MLLFFCGNLKSFDKIYHYNILLKTMFEPEPPIFRVSVLYSFKLVANHDYANRYPQRDLHIHSCKVH
jgi:hypothetical protein